MKNNEMNARKDLLNVYEVKEILRIPLSTVYYLTKNKVIKSMRIGKHIRYRKQDIDYYLENGFFRKDTPIVGKNKYQIERRAYPRMNCNIECDYSITLPQKNNLNEGILKNISGGGVFLHDKTENLNSVSVMDPIELNFELIYRNEIYMIKTGGRVVRKDEEGVVIYGIGIKFRNIDENYKKIIIRYVD